MYHIAIKTYHKGRKKEKKKERRRQGGLRCVEANEFGIQDT
jgi:hypothetical protein